MIKLAALAVAAASTASSPALDANAPWWEKVTVTIAGDGEAQACHYESSRAIDAAGGCEVNDSKAALAANASSGTLDQVTKITFERRFIPGGSQPTQHQLKPGDTLLGGQVMALAIDEAGAVTGCKVVARAGDVTPDYGCTEATAERFEAAAGDAAEAEAEGFMTVLVYGHQENVA